MSDTEKTSSDTSTTSNADQSTTTPSNCHSGACCKPHTSLYISIAALALAGYAAFNVSSNHDNSAIQTEMNNLESKLSGINQQMETLSQAVQDNRDNLVQNKLKKALENIRDISGIAEEGSKAAISKVESMLQHLTTMGEQLIAPTPNVPTQTEPTSVEPSTPEAAIASPQPETPPTEPTTAESAVPESSASTTPATDKAVAIEATSANEIPAESNAASAANKAIEPAIKTMPESDPSAPQAF